MVAAIEEIVRSSSDKYVLVCANSNAACDEITQRLLQVLKSNEIFRMYAKSTNEMTVKSEIKKCYNFKDGEFRYPSLNFLYQYRVLVCTLLTAGTLMRARDNFDFDSGHFSYLIIDECASTNEPTSLVPIAGMCILFKCSESPIKCIVLTVFTLAKKEP